MKAIVNHSYGSPDVLRYEEIEKPVPADDEVLLRIHAAAVNPLDAGELKGLPAPVRLIFGLSKPEAARPGRPGVDVAGIVEAVGASAGGVKAGDEVFGLCLSYPRASGVKVWVHHQGSFAEYASVPASMLVLKPPNVTFAQAASVPVAALTALQGLRDKGHLGTGQSVLIHGAGGGVGTFAVQIAKSFGAEVTAVSSTAKLEMLRSIGADHLIDHTREDFTQSGRHYDLIFDCYASHPLSSCRCALKPAGTYVGVGPPAKAEGLGMLSRFLQMLIFSRLTSHKLVTFLARPKRDDLVLIGELLATGKIIPVIDRTYRLPEAAEALRFLQEGHPGGKIIIAIG